MYHFIYAESVLRTRNYSSVVKLSAEKAQNALSLTKATIWKDLRSCWVFFWRGDHNCVGYKHHCFVKQMPHCQNPPPSSWYWILHLNRPQRNQCYSVWEPGRTMFLSGPVAFFFPCQACWEVQIIMLLSTSVLIFLGSIGQRIDLIVSYLG